MAMKALDPKKFPTNPVVNGGMSPTNSNNIGVANPLEFDPAEFEGLFGVGLQNFGENFNSNFNNQLGTQFDSLNLGGLDGRLDTMDRRLSGIDSAVGALDLSSLDNLGRINEGVGNLSGQVNQMRNSMGELQQPDYSGAISGLSRDIGSVNQNFSNFERTNATNTSNLSSQINNIDFSPIRQAVQQQIGGVRGDIRRDITSANEATNRAIASGDAANGNIMRKFGADVSRDLTGLNRSVGASVAGLGDDLGGQIGGLGRAVGDINFDREFEGLGRNVNSGLAGIRSGLSGVGDQVGSQIGDARADIAGLGRNTNAGLASVRGNLNSGFGTVRSGLTGVGRNLDAGFAGVNSGVTNNIGDVRSDLSGLGNQVGNINFDADFSNLGRNINSGLTGLNSGINSGFGGINSGIAGLGREVDGINFDSEFAGLGRNIGAVNSGISGVNSSINAGFGGINSGIAGLGREVDGINFDSEFAGLGRNIGAVNSGISGVNSNLGAGFGGINSGIAGLGREVDGINFDSEFAGLGRNIGQVNSGISGVNSNLDTGFGGVNADISGLGDGLRGGIAGLGDQVGNINFDSEFEGLGRNLGSQIGSAGDDINANVNSSVDGLGNRFDAIEGSMSGGFGSIEDRLNGWESREPGYGTGGTYDDGTWGGSGPFGGGAQSGGGNSVPGGALPTPPPGTTDPYTDPVQEPPVTVEDPADLPKVDPVSDPTVPAVPTVPTVDPADAYRSAFGSLSSGFYGEGGLLYDTPYGTGNDVYDSVRAFDQRSGANPVNIDDIYSARGRAEEALRNLDAFSRDSRAQYGDEMFSSNQGQYDELRASLENILGQANSRIGEYNTEGQRLEGLGSDGYTRAQQAIQALRSNPNIQDMYGENGANSLRDQFESILSGLEGTSSFRGTDGMFGRAMGLRDQFDEAYNGVVGRRNVGLDALGNELSSITGSMGSLPEHSSDGLDALYQRLMAADGQLGGYGGEGTADYATQIGDIMSQIQGRRDSIFNRRNEIEGNAAALASRQGGLQFTNLDDLMAEERQFEELQRNAGLYGASNANDELAMAQGYLGSERGRLEIDQANNNARAEAELMDRRAELARNRSPFANANLPASQFFDGMDPDSYMAMLLGINSNRGTRFQEGTGNSANPASAFSAALSQLR